LRRRGGTSSGSAKCPLRRGGRLCDKGDVAAAAPFRTGRPRWAHSVDASWSPAGANDDTYVDEGEDLCTRYGYAEDTIVAVVTAVSQSEGGVAIVRLSGPEAVGVVQRMFRPGPASSRQGNTWVPTSHQVSYGYIVDEASNTLVDEVLVIPMLAPRSYTTEDVVEIQCHGGSVCCQRILSLCFAGGARHAEPGEFTLRAFLNGRLDLSQAESISQLVSARTAQAADAAIAGLQGGLSNFIRAMRTECIDLLVEMEARLDFDDELPPLDRSMLVDRLKKMQADVDYALSRATLGRVLDTGVSVAIIGRPNVGKSSLLNAMSGTTRAIVTDIPGTTRDVVDTEINVRGVCLRLLDTAGIREAADEVEQIGVKRSEAAVRAADVALFVVSAQDGWMADDADIFQSIWGRESKAARGSTLSGPMAPMTGAERCEGERDQEGLEPAPAILVFNKADLGDAKDAEHDLPGDIASHFQFLMSTSALDGSGVHELQEQILELVGVSGDVGVGGGWVVNQRQAQSLAFAKASLKNVENSIREDLPIDFWTIDVKGAAEALREIDGEEVAEDVLSNIFSRFCIGK